MTPNSQLAQILYEKAIREKIDGQRVVLRIALECGVGEKEVYKWLTNRKNIPAYALPGILRATRSRELFERLTGVHDVNLVIVDRKEASESFASSKDVALELGAQSGGVLQAVRDAEEDGVITEDELINVEWQINRLQQHAEALRTKLNQRCREAHAC